jgi:putative endopeptidase
VAKVSILVSASVLLLTLTVQGEQQGPPIAPTPRLSGIDLSGMDRSVPPQNDFYQFVNGTWLAKTQLPADKPAYGAFAELADAAEKHIRALIETAGGQPDRREGTVAQQVGDFFESFMNDRRVEELGRAPVQRHLDRIAAVKTMAEFATLIGEFSTIGIAGVTNESIEPDAKDPSANIVTLYQAGTSLPEREYYLSEDAKYVEIRGKYVEYLTKIFGLMGSSAAADDAKAVLALETDIARVQWTPVESRDAIKTYNKIPVARLNTEFPGLDWLAWAHVQGYDKVPDVIVSQPSFMAGVGTLASSRPLDAWKAWMRAHVIVSEGRLLSKPFVDANFEFFGRTLSGQEQNRERWKRGVALVQGSLPEAVGKLYVEKHFPPAAKCRMEVMVANLIEAYRQSISTLDWMTADTKKEALAKLAKFTAKIGYPDKFRSYDGLVIKKGDLIGNAERAIKFETEFQVAKLGRPVDRSLWLMPPQEVNAYYNPLQNEIVFPAAILQPPFFNFEADDAVNYGGIGAVIGHEIGHGFDDQGRHYDGDGRLREWWTKSDDEEFRKRAKLLVQQFDAFEPLPGLHVNGNLTLGENIGDLGGLSIAYKAYKLSLGGKPSPQLDGFSGEQRVFIGWAQAWREKARDEFLRMLVTSNPHAPSRYRGGNPPTNIDAFYEAFNVKPGDKMYRPPAERVRIW